MPDENYQAPFPHCDQNVLHAPGDCEFCDSYPERQEERIAKRVNFTGQSDPAKDPCPSEAFRPPHVAHQWPGNRPTRVKVNLKPPVAKSALERLLEDE